MLETLILFLEFSDERSLLFGMRDSTRPPFSSSASRLCFPLVQSSCCLGSSSHGVMEGLTIMPHLYFLLHAKFHAHDLLASGGFARDHLPSHKQTRCLHVAKYFVTLPIDDWFKSGYDTHVGQYKTEFFS